MTLFPQKPLAKLISLAILTTITSSALATTTPPPPPPPAATEPTLQVVRDNTQAIKDNTTTIVNNLYNLPVFFSNVMPFLRSWTSPDTSDASANIQSTFSQLGKLLVENLSNQSKLQTQLNSDLLTGTNKTNLPNANDLVYTTMLGSPYYSDDPRGKNAVPQYNYVKNASGIGLIHTLPSQSWRGDQAIFQQYQSYYDSVLAIESFGGYVLSNQYADGNQFNELQKQLINQASDPQNWFAQIASESIGWVLRQLLMYQSQTFVLMTQLVQTQKQMATAQVMTNTLLIANNINNENDLVTKAQTTG